MSARFDDLSSLDTATELVGPGPVFEAQTCDEVRDVLRSVEAAAARGWWVAGFVGYEAAPGLDPTLVTRPVMASEALGDLPVAWFACFAEALTVPTVAAGASGGAAHGLRSRGCAARRYMAEPWQLTPDEDVHAKRVAAVRAHIAAGATYQVNLTGRLWSRLDGDLFGCYRDLAVGQRGAYGAFLDTGRHVIASASPELFFSWKGDQLTARPMKGTTGRGRWPDEDEAFARALVESAKDRAENVMIVDLVRNDLGRIAAVGSVEVAALCALERFPTLFQLTSSLTATLRPEVGLTDIFTALFPSGSVTGAPKRRSMELITELEESRRGCYTGAVGFVAPPDAPQAPESSTLHGQGVHARFNVAIRTIVVDRRDGTALYGSGGGITWSSEAATEYRELLTKTAVLHVDSGEFSLLETMAFQPGRGLVNGARHLRRMERSANYFGFIFDVTRTASALTSATAAVDEASRVRLALERSGAVHVSVDAIPTARDGPVLLAVDDEPVSSSDAFLCHKTSRREPYASRAARHPGADDVLLVNERGNVTESTIANLAVLLDGKWFTPPVGSGCLPGVERTRRVEYGLLVDRDLALADLRRADEIALVSSLRGWRRAELLT